MTGRGGGTVRISCCSSRAGSSIASARSGCGARKACGLRGSAASAGGWGIDGAGQPAAGPGPRRCVGDRLSVRSDGRQADLEAAARRGRVDEFTREALAIECHRRIDADHTVRVRDRLVAERGRVPAHLRCDNGPEMTANALRDWCRFSRAGSAYIEPGSPWQNPYVESFGSRVRDELLAVELFSCLTEAQVLIEDWRQDYNHHRPHSALGMMTPHRFAVGYREAHLAAAPASIELRSPYGLAPFDAGGSLNLQSPTNHQLSQQVDR